MNNLDKSFVSSDEPHAIHQKPKQVHIGDQGEELIRNFFDSNISKFYSFPNPKSKDKAEVADVVVWHNRKLLLIEVKTRDTEEATTSLESWATKRIEKSFDQICRNYDRCINNETIHLHNDFFHVQFNRERINYYIGIIILVCDNKCNLLPTDVIPNIYKKEFPFHVFTWNDICALHKEIDTFPDLFYYLQDRYEYISNYDIPLDTEKEVISYYKIHRNKFPKDETDFASDSFESEYQASMSSAIDRRNTHNAYSSIVDELEACFSNRRKMFEGLPIGLYFVWEVGSQTRRQRAYIGKKLYQIRNDFEQGKKSRQFAFFNQASGNWHVYYFSKDTEQNIVNKFSKILKRKLIKEVHISGFKYRIYGFAFQVSMTVPFRLLGLQAAVVMGADEVKGYSCDDLHEAFREWGRQKHTSEIPIREFPDPC